MIRGRIVRTQSGFLTVDTEEGQIVSQLRGRLKQGDKEGDIAALGDWVKISINEDGSGMVEEIEERENTLYRLAPTARGVYQQIIVANLDQALIVFSCAKPEPKLRMLDRFLVLTEKENIPTVILFNKVDLVSTRTAKREYGFYENIGYRVLYTSAESGKGIRQLRSLLRGKTSVLAGPSGVGKSSLLNAVQPGLGLEVKEVSQATRKGRHTTVVREMYPLDGGGYVADTPGLKSLGLWDIEPEEVDGYFPEIAERVMDCQFSDCTHIHEPGCAVIEAVENGDIHFNRYESYVMMRLGEEEERGY